jgi:hypothetical protein
MSRNCIIRFLFAGKCCFDATRVDLPNAEGRNLLRMSLVQLDSPPEYHRFLLDAPNAPRTGSIGRPFQAHPGVRL